MIKPDGVAKGLVDQIISRIEGAGLQISSIRRMRLDRELAEKLYEVHKGADYFEPLVDFMVSGEVVVMVVEGERAVARMRELAGPTDSTKAPKGTIRGDFGTSTLENIIHAADSAESAKRELALFF